MINLSIVILMYLELRQAFDLFDTDSSGGISVNELQKALCALDVNLTEQEVRQIFSAIDVDSNKISLTEEKVIQNSFLENGFVAFQLKPSGESCVCVFFSSRSY